MVRNTVDLAIVWYWNIPLLCCIYVECTHECTTLIVANTNVAVSSVPPADETVTGALDFALWEHLGSNFIVTSTINNGIRCTPNGPPNGRLNNSVSSV